jgi:hypothetical protein
MRGGVEICLGRVRAWPVVVSGSPPRRSRWVGGSVTSTGPRLVSLLHPADGAGVLVTVHRTVRAWSSVRCWRHPRSLRPAAAGVPDDPAADGPRLAARPEAARIPGIVAASADDALGNPVLVRSPGAAWGCRLHALGPVGHLNPASGFGERPAVVELIEELDCGSVEREVDETAVGSGPPPTGGVARPGRWPGPLAATPRASRRLPMSKGPSARHEPAALVRSTRPRQLSGRLPRGPSRPGPASGPSVRPYGQFLGSPADVASLRDPSRVVFRHSVGLVPNCRRNQREKALGALKPSSCDTSVSEYRSLGR